MASRSWLRRDDLWPLGAMGILLLTTGLWWALALWPLPATAPPWLERARYVCFNTTESGLPDRSGWILLIGQPLGMVGILLAGWGARVRETLRHLRRTAPGKVLLSGMALLLLGGITGASVRVADARIPPATLPSGEVSESYPRLDMALPAMSGVVDQTGRPFSLELLQGRPALVTFTYGHCATVCPLLVRNALDARRELGGTDRFAIVVLTMDPWRDTPSRLEALAAKWELEPGDLILSGSVEDVQAALDAWQVARVRDEQTGDLTHTPLTYLMEADGTVAYASTGSRTQIVALAERLR